MIHALLAKIARTLDDAGIPYMVIGGQAVLIHGEFRVTRDVDVTIGLSALDDATAPRVLEVIDQLGAQPIVEDAEAFVREAMVIPCHHQATGMHIDFAFTDSEYERQAIERATLVEMEGVAVRVATPEDLIVHKAVAGRPRDLQDIEGILARQSSLDVEYIRHWLRQFDQLYEQPCLERFETILRRQSEDGSADGA